MFTIWALDFWAAGFWATDLWTTNPAPGGSGSGFWIIERRRRR